MRAEDLLSNLTKNLSSDTYAAHKHTGQSSTGFPLLTPTPLGTEQKPSSAVKETLLGTGLVKPYLQQQTKKTFQEQTVAFDMLFALTGRPVSFKSGNNSHITEAATAAVEQALQQHDVERFIRRLEPSALIQITRAVRDKVADINTHDTTQTRSRQPVWETQALINRVCAVRKVHVYNQDIDEWTHSEIGMTAREQIRSIDHLLRSNNAIPQGNGINQYCRDIAENEHTLTAYFCIGQAAAKRSPFTKVSSPDASPAKPPTPQPKHAVLHQQRANSQS